MAPRHDELDGFGIVRVSACLRWLAQLAVDASSAVGFGPEWYDANGLMWLVRRTTLELMRPIRRSERLSLRTWVEDFRRVRSHRVYELRDDEGADVGRGRTDWVLIATASGRPVRVPAEIEAGFGVPRDRAGTERPAWQEPPPPAQPAHLRHLVRFADLDSLVHVNNATYVDFLTEGALGLFAAAGWGLERLRGHDALPWVRRVDIEYLDAAVWGDTIESTTWIGARASDLTLHQHLARHADAKPLVRAETAWAWRDAAGRTATIPRELLNASLVA